MIVLDYQDRRAIYEQVTEKIQNLIFKGVLKEDSQLPSVRKLAMELSINPNTIQRAYNQLESAGIIYSVKGRGSYVAPNTAIKALELQQYYASIKKTVIEGKNIGVEKRDLISVVEEVYEEGNND